MLPLQCDKTHNGNRGFTDSATSNQRRCGTASINGASSADQQTSFQTVTATNTGLTFFRAMRNPEKKAGARDGQHRESSVINHPPSKFGHMTHIAIHRK
jgi:hypothetical protein